MRMTIGFLSAGLVLLALCALSLWNGKTVGPYATIETPASVFYWIIVVTYGGLGALSIVFALMALWR